MVPPYTTGVFFTENHLEEEVLGALDTRGQAILPTLPQAQGFRGIGRIISPSTSPFARDCVLAGEAVNGNGTF